MLADGTRVAVKRAEYGSKQGAVEFKNEIELLSRVHHRNLVSLIGFCYEQGEQMLVYEYVSNGTLRENLQGRSQNIVMYLKMHFSVSFPLLHLAIYLSCSKRNLPGLEEEAQDCSWLSQRTSIPS